MLSVSAQNTLNKVDSLRLEQLQEVVVKGVRAQKDAPFAIANIKKKELDAFSKTGRELPFLFSQTPGIEVLHVPLTALLAADFENF